MTCPDWQRLLAHRYAADREPPAEWPKAWSHLESCPDCRAAAAVIDPTVAFRGAASWVPSPEDTADILQGVRTLRRAGRLAASGTDPRRVAGTGPRHRAVAGLFVALLALLPASTGRQGVDPAAPGRLAVTPRAPIVAPRASALDGLDRPQARVYEWGGDDLSVVMVVDESLDV